MFRSVSALCILGAFALTATAQNPPEALFVSVGKDKKLSVKPVENEAWTAPGPGLLLWLDGTQERWKVLRANDTMPSSPGDAPTTRLALGEGTRGSGGTTGSAAEYAATIQLDQLRVGGGTRDIESGFRTPDRGQLLNPRPTFRRFAKEKGPPFPAATARLMSKDKKLKLNILFKNGQERIPYAELSDLPREWSKELPPGEYELGLEGAVRPSFLFTVVSAAAREKILRPVHEMERLRGIGDPLVTQFAVEHLLSTVDANGVPTQYLGDALEILEALPTEKRTPYLRAQHKLLNASLELTPEDRKKSVTGPPAPGEPTKIAEIDQARALIAAGQWDVARKVLQSKAFARKIEADARARGLTHLYLGVIASESGPTQEEAAEEHFQHALQDLAKAPETDLLRAYNNYADFLHHQAQDRLYNHALQVAAGVERPFLQALHRWRFAREHYETALGLARKTGRQQDQAVIQVNLARAYSLLADILRTLDVKAEFAGGVREASALADKLAEDAAKALQAEPDTRAIALEMRATLAYRAGDVKSCRDLAAQALDKYLEIGRLAGAESTSRLLGLTAASRGDALKHFQIAYLLAESSRERLPKDRVGATQAGFFARKAWILEKIVELLLEDGKHADALRFAELARARALQDVLFADQQGLPEGWNDSGEFRTKSWPKDAAALAYFFGTDRAWLFVVGTDGAVKAHALQDAKGQPLQPRDLVRRVQTFLRDIEGQSKKMYSRIYSGRGFDHSWQDDLHGFRQELVPDAALAEIRKARTVVIVPQHILHYFPFAALVVEKDPKARGKSEMTVPKRFLLDEPFHLVYAPSLAAWSARRAEPAGAIKEVNAVGIVQVPGADRLEGVEKDLLNLKNTFGKRMQTLLENDAAQEDQAKKLLGRPGLLFFGTHGLNDADRPLESHLMLLASAKKPGEGQGANEGRLTAREIFFTEVRSDLVVMSACYSGLGDRSPLPGDDLFGLQRSFLSSGARTVVSGLWDVYDGTAPDLMLDFFKGLEQDLSAAAALAGAQRAFLQKRRESKSVDPWIHPYFWAVYTVAGDDRTRVHK